MSIAVRTEFYNCVDGRQHTSPWASSVFLVLVGRRVAEVAAWRPRARRPRHRRSHHSAPCSTGPSHPTEQNDMMTVPQSSRALAWSTSQHGVLQSGGWHDFPGSFDAYLDTFGWFVHGRLGACLDVLPRADRCRWRWRHQRGLHVPVPLQTLCPRISTEVQELEKSAQPSCDKIWDEGSS
jgi:hypothetical protein